jgi:hypothetical protein
MKKGLLKEYAELTYSRLTSDSNHAYWLLSAVASRCKPIWEHPNSVNTSRWGRRLACPKI